MKRGQAIGIINGHHWGVDIRSFHFRLSRLGEPAYDAHIQELERTRQDIETHVSLDRANEYVRGKGFPSRRRMQTADYYLSSKLTRELMSPRRFGPQPMSINLVSKPIECSRRFGADGVRRIHWAHALWANTAIGSNSSGIQTLAKAAVLMYPEIITALSDSVRGAAQEVFPVVSSIGGLSLFDLETFLGGEPGEILHIITTGVNYWGCHLETLKSLWDHQNANPGVKMAYHLIGDLVGFSGVSAGIPYVEPMTLEFQKLKETFVLAQNGSQTAVESLKTRTYCFLDDGNGNYNPIFYLDGERPFGFTFKFDKLAMKRFSVMKRMGPKGHRIRYLYYWTSLESMARFFGGLSSSQKPASSASSSYLLEKASP